MNTMRPSYIKGEPAEEVLHAAFSDCNYKNRMLRFLWLLMLEQIAAAEIEMRVFELPAMGQHDFSPEYFR